MTGNSRRQTPHHSAQKTRYTGFCSADSVNSPPSPSASVKSGAGGPSIGGDVAGGSVASDDVVVDDDVSPVVVEVVESPPAAGAATVVCDGSAAVVVVSAPAEHEAAATASAAIRTIDLRMSAPYRMLRNTGAVRVPAIRVRW